jgi:hypothetical protein
MPTRRLRHLRALRLLPSLGLAASLVLAGCGSAQKPAPARVQASPPARLVWLPVEPQVAPEVARAINDRLDHLQVPGTTSCSRAPVSLEVAQLAIECIEASEACYGKVARSVGADRVLWAELAAGQPPAKTIRVALVLFDAGAGTVVQRAERTFEGETEARAGIAELVQRTFQAPRPAGGGAPVAARRSGTP